jgi:hypothetical protein
MTAGAVIIRATSKGHLGSQIAAGLAGGSDFNHGMLIDRLRHYEAVPWHGVRAVPSRVAMRGVVRYQDRYAVVPNIEAMRWFLEDKLGADYDWPGAVGMPFLRSSDWQDPARWWCWELIIAALGAGGLWLVDQARASGCTLHDVLESNLPSTQIIHVRGPR